MCLRETEVIRVYFYRNCLERFAIRESSFFLMKRVLERQVIPCISHSWLRAIKCLSGMKCPVIIHRPWVQMQVGSSLEMSSPCKLHLNQTLYFYSKVSQKDSGYAWFLLLVGCLARLMFNSGAAMMGVPLVVLGKTFNASQVELNVASTMPTSILFCAGKWNKMIVKMQICVSVHG